MTQKNKTFTLEELIHYRQIAAKVVALYGDTYLPVFERMHKEVLDRQKNDDLLSIAISIANEEKK